MAALFALAACAPVRLIGDYDAGIDQGTSELQRQAETYFARLASTPATPFSQDFHDAAHAQLAVLATRASVQPGSTPVTALLAAVGDDLDTLEKLDRLAPRPLQVDAQGRSGLRLGLATLEQDIRHVLALESALRRGEPLPAPTAPAAPALPAATR